MRNKPFRMAWLPRIALQAGLIAACPAMAAASNGAVVGGQAVGIEEAPWTIALNIGCTGSWIGGKWAITAAHCRDGGIQWVVGGVTRRTDVNRVPRTVVKALWVHEETDIALLELANDITAVKARPIRPAIAQDVAAGLTRPGKSGRLSGWGQLGDNDPAPDSLHLLDHRIATLDSTNPHFISYGGATGDTLQGSCFGDSGGPLAVRDAAGTGWILAGVVSSGSASCGDEEPDLYGRVSAVEAWIRQRTGGSVAVFPAPPPRISFGPNRISLSRPAEVDMVFLDLSGVAVRQIRRRFSAGAHALPSAGLPAGYYAVRVQGEGLRMQGRIIIPQGGRPGNPD